jgi:hypothetical protein
MATLPRTLPILLPVLVAATSGSRAADARPADLGPDDRDAAGRDRLEAAQAELEQAADARGDEAARELVHGQRGDGDLLDVGRQGEEGVDEGLRRLRRDLHAARDRVERDVAELGEEAAAAGATRLVEGVGDEVDALLHEGQDPLDQLLEDRDALRGDDRDEAQQRRREPLARLLAHVRHPLAHDVELARQGLAHRRRGAADLLRQGVLGRAEGVGLELRLVDDDAVLAERPGVAVEGLADRLGGRLEADPLRLRQVEDERRELEHLVAGRAEAEQHRVGALDRVVVDAGQVEQRARLLVDRRRLGLADLARLLDLAVEEQLLLRRVGALVGPALDREHAGRDAGHGDGRGGAHAEQARLHHPAADLAEALAVGRRPVGRAAELVEALLGRAELRAEVVLEAEPRGELGLFCECHLDAPL